MYSLQWRPYVRVADRRRNAARLVAKLRKQGRTIAPIELEGRTIARTFWGTAWCDNLESYSDYANRLPRGRSYVRNGSVIDLQIEPGTVTALVSGSEIYDVRIEIRRVPKRRWRGLVDACAGQVDSLVDLLAGELADGVMQILARHETGLFPAPPDISLDCSCPDWAGMCKHVAAVLYGVGARLDREPELLFRLRRVDATDLIARVGDSGDLGRLTRAGARADLLEDDDLSNLFGIELDEPAAPARRGKREAGPRKRRHRSKSITARELIERGVPRTTFQNWLSSGALRKTKRRGVYKTTASTEARIERALERRHRDARARDA
jgi:uncharacterized Zn finger protein